MDDLKSEDSKEEGSATMRRRRRWGRRCPRREGMKLARGRAG